MEKARTCNEFFSSDDWDALLKALLRNLFVGDVSDESWKTLSPAKKRTLNRMCTGTTGPKSSYVRPADEPQYPTMSAPQVLSHLGNKVPAKKGTKQAEARGTQPESWAPEPGEYETANSSDYAEGWQNWE